MTKLIAIHSVQSYDEKQKRRVDYKPGQAFEVETAAEAGDLIAAGAARAADTGEKGAVAPGSTADGLPTPPTGYAAGTATNADVVADPHAEPDTGNADPDTALGEAADGKSSSKSAKTGLRR